MLIRQFPDIEWLKSKIRQDFSDQKALNDMPLKHQGWPSIVLNTKVKATERRDIKGPFSLFVNLSGNSIVGIDNRQYQINEQCYALSNMGQHYDLLIDNADTTETLNIHFGEHFFLESIQALTQTDRSLLDNPFEVKQKHLNISPHSLLKSPELDLKLKKLMASYKSDDVSHLEDEMLFEVLQEVLIANSKEIKRGDALPIQSKATQEEIVNRLFLARDYIHSYFFREISLEELSQISCLSKFHFLRLFKKAFSISPYQYQKKLRASRAITLYKQGQTLEAIAGRVGMENASSLSRMIYKQYGAYPSQIIQ